MRARSRVLRKAALVSALFILSMLPSASNAQAQPASLIHPEIAAQASVLVDGSVSVVSYVEIDGLPHTIAEFAVTDTLKGSSNETVIVVAEGGLLADGRRVIASHAAQFIVGLDLQLALIEAPPAVAAAGAVASGQAPEIVYTVVGGDAGAAYRSPTAAQFAGVNDYVLAGFGWASFAPPLTYLVNPSGSGLDPNVTVAAAQRAAQQWEDDPGSLIDTNYAGQTTSVGHDLFDGQNVVSFQAVDAGFLAQAYWLIDSNGIQFDILVNANFTFGDRSGTGQWYDLETTLLHEFGHVLGLGHASSTEEVMSSFVPAASAKPLGAGDRNGVAKLYPAPLCNGLPETVNLATGNGQPTAGPDVIFGTAGDDVINGLGGDDVICGLGGNDTINGGPGADTILGGPGNDTIYGGDGLDTINGETGNDEIHGEIGWDRLTGAGGDDIIVGGPGSDQLFGGFGDDTMHGGDGNDLLLGFHGDDTINGDAGRDLINGQNDNDTIDGGSDHDQIWGRLGDDIIEGGSGPDWIWGYWGRDTISGGPGDDRIYGEGGNDDLRGGEGNDVLDGSYGEDVLLGDAGDDVLVGGFLDDILLGNQGNDTLDGGTGNDTCDGGSDADNATACEIVTNTP